VSFIGGESIHLELQQEQSLILWKSHLHNATGIFSSVTVDILLEYAMLCRVAGAAPFAFFPLLSEKDYHRVCFDMLILLHSSWTLHTFLLLLIFFPSTVKISVMLSNLPPLVPSSITPPSSITFCTHLCNLNSQHVHSLPWGLDDLHSTILFSFSA